MVAAVAAADATVLCDEYDAASVTEQRLLVEAAILHCGAEKTAITTTSTSTSTSTSMSTSISTSARSKKGPARRKTGCWRP